MSELLPADISQQEKLNRCEEAIGYQFRDRSLLVAALTHASGAEHRVVSNERLEFLGDSVLGLVVCNQLYHRFPEYLEGDLTQIKSIVVSRVSCASLSESLGLERCLIVGKGMVGNGQGVPMSLLADVFEALVAAVYLDGGFEVAERFVRKHVGPKIELAASGQMEGNFKSQLQQLAQREFGITPVYQLLSEKGPDHSKCFLVTAQIGKQRYEPAWGSNKKEAEQRAACNALAQIAEALPACETD